MIKVRYWLLIIVLLSQCSCRKTTVTTIKLAHSLDTNHPVHKGMVYMANKVKERSKGDLLIEIYPNQQLGTERQCLELIQIGSLDMTKVSAGVMENFAPSIQVLCLPYIFKDRDHAYRVLDGAIGKSLLYESEKYLLKGLAYFDAGYRSFYSKYPINRPEDLSGQKIRVMESVSAIEMVKKLGGSPTPISWGELYTALQQGIVDGAENNPPSFYLSKHFELCKYYTLDEHTYIPDILVIGTNTWNRLDEKQRNWVSLSAKEATNYQRVLWQESERESLEAVIEAGVKVTKPDKSIFEERTQQIINSFKDDPEKYSIIKKINSMQ